MRLFNVGKLFWPATEGSQPDERTENTCDDSTANEALSRAAMESRLFEYMLSFWHVKRVNEAVPDWTAFQPADHLRLLPHIMLFEASSERFFTRIVGESVAAHLPVKLSNQFLDDVVPAGLSDLTVQIARACEEGQPTYSERSDAWPLNQDSIGYKALTLPFRSQNGSVDRVLSVILFRVEPVIG